MAGLWEPVSGVFWSTPPAPPSWESSWLFTAITVCTLVVVFAIAALTKRFTQKEKPQKWSMRDHLGKIGGALTLVYLAIIVDATSGRVGTLLTMPLNELGDFLAGAFGPVAFLWLVFGFLQQGDELRQGTKALELQAFELKNSVQQQSIMAAAATQQIEAQRAALQLQLDEIERGNRANFVFGYGMRIGNSVPGAPIETSIEISCSGANAHDVRVVFDPPVGSTTSAEFELISQNQKANVTVKFKNAAEDIVGVLTLSYKGADAREREEKFVYSIRTADPWVKVKNQISI